MRRTIMRSTCTVPAALFLAVLMAGCSRGPEISPSEVRVARATALPASPDDPAWDAAPLHPAALLLQDMVEPRLLTASTREVRVQALTDGTGVAFRLVWDDATLDDLPGAARFSDACAVQLPAKSFADVPAPQMGEPGRPVEITYWRSAWQAVVDGRPDTIQELYPGATVDHYPFEAASLTPGSDEQRAMADRYAPARALGNVMAGPRERPVQDLIAEGPGTTSPAASTRSEGMGRRDDAGWSVVLSRPLPESLSGAGRSQVAFAVWEGGQGEAGSRKMRTGWIPIVVEAAP